MSEWQLFGFCALWVIAGGLLLQLIVLPYVVPHAHWGHGIIAGQDSIWFHTAAVETVDKIRAQGWGAWRQAVNYPIALTSAIYAVTYPEPWVVLPVNGILFGVAIVAVRRLLAVTFDSRATGLVALTPFFIFPSFVPIWGQLHRDLNTGAGLSLVLCGLVLAGRKGRGFPGLLACVMIALAGMGLIWLSRSYVLALVAAGAVAFATVALLAKHCERLRVLTVALVVVLAAGSSVWAWTTKLLPPEALTPVAASPSTAAPPPAASRPVAPAVTPDCLPLPTVDTVDRLLYNLCRVHEGFVLDSVRLNAASGFDYNIRLRTLGDFIAYSPLALERALLEPGPQRWMTETTPIGRLGRYLVPFEMLVAYSCFILAAVLAYRCFARLEIWAPIVFCVTYALIYAFAAPQLGTLYRMRAFAFAILVSTALAALVARLKAAE